MQLLRNQIMYYFQDRREERHIGECQGRKGGWHLVLGSQMYGLRDDNKLLSDFLDRLKVKIKTSITLLLEMALRLK